MEQPRINDKKTLINAIKRYGVESQMMMAIEEMAELQKEVCNFLRARDNNIAEEMADVYIMLWQMQHMMFIGEEVQLMIDQKVERLKERLKGGEAE